jgi:uncharacterized lipoprotein YddW (UPF0748 family)
MSRVLPLIACLAAALAANAPSAAPAKPMACPVDPSVPKRQFRAMWLSSVVNIDWPSRPGLDIATAKAEYIAWLELARAYNHNAIVVQVRPTADTFWPSPHEPWSRWLTGSSDAKDPGWDPLAFMVEEAHARNLEFHAWFNPFRASMPAATGSAGGDIERLDAAHPLRQHRDWAVAYPAQGPRSQLYYDPGVPQARAFVQQAIMHAVDHYDIDAVHLDDYFYPYPVNGEDFADDGTFARYHEGFADRDAWRRHNVDQFVRDLGARIKASKPWVKFGISPSGIWRNSASDPLGSDTRGAESYSRTYADTRAWVKANWLDYVAPQIYWNIGLPVADYAKLVPWWADVVSGTQAQLYIGQADYKIGANNAAWNEVDEMDRHLRLNRQYAVAGNIHFSAKQVLANRLGATSHYADRHYSRPALVPVMEHLPGQDVPAPARLRVARQTDGAALSWEPGAGPAAVAFGIYRLDGALRDIDPCALADASHLLGTTRATSFHDGDAAPGKAYTYVVTAMDRTHKEGPAATARLHASPAPGWLIFDWLGYPFPWLPVSPVP